MNSSAEDGEWRGGVVRNVRTDTDLVIQKLIHNSEIAETQIKSGIFFRSPYVYGWTAFVPPSVIELGA